MNVPHADPDGATSPTHVTFRASGRAHPERAGWWFDPVGLRHRDERGLLTSVTAVMRQSQFTAWLTTRASNAPEPLDAKVVLEDFVRSTLDTIGLFQGSAADCEVVELELPDGQILILDSSFEGLGREFSVEEFRVVALTAQLVRGLRLGLADFRMAVRFPQDTLWLAYRALEGIRADVAAREQIANDRASWDRARTLTQIARAEIDAIKTKADARRHGRPVDVSHEERGQALRLVQRALVAYASWCATEIPEVREVLGRAEAH